MIVHKAMCDKASQPWIIWEGVTKLIYSLRPGVNQQTSADVSSSSINRLEQFGLLSSGKANQGLDRQKDQRGLFHTMAQLFWASLQVTALVWLLLRSFVIALMHASSIPTRQNRISRTKSPDKVQVSAVDPASRPSPQYTIEGHYEKRPVVTMRIWTCIATLTVIERRMPWFSGFLSLLQWLSLHGPGRLCRTDSLLDR